MIEILIWLAILAMACAGLAAGFVIVGITVLTLRSWWVAFLAQWREIGR